MERIISYDDLPLSLGQSVYLRMESDPRLYVSLLSKSSSFFSHLSTTFPVINPFSLKNFKELINVLFTVFL